MGNDFILLFNLKIIALQSHVVLVYAVQQHESVITIHIYSLTLEPPSSPPCRHRAPGQAPCVIHQLPTSYLFYILTQHFKIQDPVGETSIFRAEQQSLGVVFFFFLEITEGRLLGCLLKLFPFLNLGDGYGIFTL